MVRVRTTRPAHRRKQRVLKQAKGYFGHRSRRFQQAKKAVIKAMVYSYRDRKVRKRDFRRLWIARINAACRENGVAYSRFIKGLTDAKIEINRKVIAELAVSSPDAFKQLLKASQQK